jgi:hypothetical protein
MHSTHSVVSTSSPVGQLGVEPCDIGTVLWSLLSTELGARDYSLWKYCATVLFSLNSFRGACGYCYGLGLKEPLKAGFGDGFSMVLQGSEVTGTE